MVHRQRPSRTNEQPPPKAPWLPRGSPPPATPALQGQIPGWRLGPGPTCWKSARKPKCRDQPSSCSEVLPPPPPTRGNGISSEMHLLAQPRPVPTHFPARPRARRGGRGRSSQSPHVARPTEGGFLVGFTVRILLCVCSTEMTCTRHQTQSGFWLGGSLSPGFHVQRCGLHPQAVF